MQDIQNLFESYYRGCKNNDLKKEEKEFLCDFICNISNNDDKEVLFLLIYYYYINIHHRGDVSKIDINSVAPFEGVDVMDDDGQHHFQLSLLKLPYKLRQILYKFCKMLENNERRE